MSKVVSRLHEHKIMPICFDRRLGQIIAQTIIDPRMEDVYLSMFSFDDSEVYMIKDMDFEDCLKNCSHAIPITKHNKDLFVLSLNDESKDIINQKNYDLKELQLKRNIKPRNMDVFIIGKNNKFSFIMESFKEYEALYESDFNARYVTDDEFINIVKEINSSNKPVTIVLLSDEKQDLESLDANVIENLIYLQGNIKRHDINIIVELLDPKNDHIVKDFDIENTIISNKIISLLLSKLALYKETAPFYENLLTIKSDVTGKDDQNIFIIKSIDYVKSDMPIIFNSIKELIISFYYSSKTKYIPIGYIRDEKLVVFEGDMSIDKEISIIETDHIVLFKI